MRAAKIDRLFVLWCEPAHGRRHVVGHLSRSVTGARFWYQPDLSRAMADGFDYLPAFPSHRGEDQPYEARYLWSTFADRIPSPKRPDAKEILERWGVAGSDDQFEILARSGGLRATDRIELAEYRAANDRLAVPLEFRVAGMSFVEPQQRARMSVGVRLRLVREPDNVVDPCAAALFSDDGMRAGYVPRQYSELIASLVDAGVQLDVQTVRTLLVPDDVGRWIVRVSRT